MPTPEISVTKPVVKDITLTKDYPGYLTTEQTVNLVARVNGTLQSTSYTPGGRVKKGQLLFVIEPTLYKDKVEQAKADLQTAQAQLEYARSNYSRMKEGVMEEVKRMFKPEFLNRIDEIIVFHTLNKEEVKKIVGILLKDLTLRCKDQMGIELKVRDSVKELIAKEGFDPKYGARPLRRAIQNKIEDAMAEEILEGRIKQGDKVIIGVSKEKIKFMVKHD